MGCQGKALKWLTNDVAILSFIMPPTAPHDAGVEFWSLCRSLPSTSLTSYSLHFLRYEAFWCDTSLCHMQSGTLHSGSGSLYWWALSDRRQSKKYPYQTYWTKVPFLLSLYYSQHLSFSHLQLYCMFYSLIYTLRVCYILFLKERLVLLHQLL